MDDNPQNGSGTTHEVWPGEALLRSNSTGGNPISIRRIGFIDWQMAAGPIGPASYNIWWAGGGKGLHQGCPGLAAGLAGAGVQDLGDREDRAYRHWWEVVCRHLPDFLEAHAGDEGAVLHRDIGELPPLGLMGGPIQLNAGGVEWDEVYDHLVGLVEIVDGLHLENSVLVLDLLGFEAWGH